MRLNALVSSACAISRRFLRRSEWRPFRHFEFLQRYPPFADLDPAALELLGDVVDVEYHRAGQIIFSQGEDPVEFLRVIRTGSSSGQRRTVLNLLEMGEISGTRQCCPVFRLASRLAQPRTHSRTDFRRRPLLRYWRPWSVALRHATHLEDRHHLRSGHRAKQPGLSSPTRSRRQSQPRPSAHHRRRFARRLN